MRAEIGRCGTSAVVLSLSVAGREEVASAQGLLGYSFLARPLSKRFWTLSAWEIKQNGISKNCLLLLWAGG